MRKMMLLAAMVAIAALMMAATPARADDNNEDGRDDYFCDFFDCRDNDNNNVVPAITQDFDQEAESGDIDQSFDVSQTGDNSNQTVSIQGVGTPATPRTR